MWKKKATLKKVNGWQESFASTNHFYVLSQSLPRVIFWHETTFIVCKMFTSRLPGAILWKPRFIITLILLNDDNYKYMSNWSNILSKKSADIHHDKRSNMKYEGKRAKMYLAVCGLSTLFLRPSTKNFWSM